MKIQDDDILLLNQGGTDYKITAKQYKEFVNSNPWDGAKGIYHVIIDDPADIHVNGQEHIYKLDTKTEVSSIDAPGEWIITGDQTLFYDSPGNWDFGELTDTSKVKEMDVMFYGTLEFNSDISNWDVSNVTDMYMMFYDAKKFNQDLSGWCVSNVKKNSRFADGAVSWVLPKPVWGTCPRGEDQ